MKRGSFCPVQDFERCSLFGQIFLQELVQAQEFKGRCSDPNRFDLVLSQRGDCVFPPNQELMEHWGWGVTNTRKVNNIAGPTCRGREPESIWRNGRCKLKIFSSSSDPQIQWLLCKHSRHSFTYFFTIFLPRLYGAPKLKCLDMVLQVIE